MSDSISIIEKANKLVSAVKPVISIDGDMWCCLYGENLQVGIAGFGPSPQRAVTDFYRLWNAELND